MFRWEVFAISAKPNLLHWHYFISRKISQSFLFCTSIRDSSWSKRHLCTYRSNWNPLSALSDRYTVIRISKYLADSPYFNLQTRPCVWIFSPFEKVLKSKPTMCLMQALCFSNSEQEKKETCFHYSSNIFHPICLCTYKWVSRLKNIFTHIVQIKTISLHLQTTVVWIIQISKNLPHLPKFLNLKTLTFAVGLPISRLDWGYLPLALHVGPGMCMLAPFSLLPCFVPSSFKTFECPCLLPILRKIMHRSVKNLYVHVCPSFLAPMVCPSTFKTFQCPQLLPILQKTMHGSSKNVHGYVCPPCFFCFHALSPQVSFKTFKCSRLLPILWKTMYGSSKNVHDHACPLLFAPMLCPLSFKTSQWPCLLPILEKPMHGSSKNGFVGMPPPYILSARHIF